jgi:hypothetical protein
VDLTVDESSEGPREPSRSRYERTYGTDWETLDRDAAVERAYALGVAATLGESHPGELEAVRAEVDTAYDRSVVELAFDEGRAESRQVERDAGDGVATWAALIERADPVATGADGDDTPAARERGLPGAIERIEALARPDRDSTDLLDRPDFLERD